MRCPPRPSPRTGGLSSSLLLIVGGTLAVTLGAVVLSMFFPAGLKGFIQLGGVIVGLPTGIALAMIARRSDRRELREIDSRRGYETLLERSAGRFIPGHPALEPTAHAAHDLREVVDGLEELGLSGEEAARAARPIIARIVEQIALGDAAARTMVKYRHMLDGVSQPTIDELEALRSAERLRFLETRARILAAGDRSTEDL